MSKKFKVGDMSAEIVQVQHTGTGDEPPEAGVWLRGKVAVKIEGDTVMYPTTRMVNVECLSDCDTDHESWHCGHEGERIIETVLLEQNLWAAPVLITMAFPTLTMDLGLYVCRALRTAAGMGKEELTC